MEQAALQMRRARQLARRLSEDGYADFLARYRARLLPRLENARPYLFTFKRILFWAQRSP